MKLSNLLILFLLFISSNLFSQAHNFRCLENEVYSIGCTTCDNSRTGKMITGMEVDIDGRKTELYNPIIAKYTTTTVTLIDYKFTTVTIKLASTYFASIADLLNAVKVCSDIGFSAGIDTLTYTNDTLKISFTNDSLAAYKIKIGDEQYIDTATYASDTLKLSLFNDKKAQTKIYLPASTGTDDQKIDTFSIVSNSLRLSLESDAEIYKSVSLSPYLDNTDAQKIDTFSLSNDSIKLSLEGDAEKYKSFSLNEYRQKIDTFSYSSDTLRIGLSNDSSLYKKVYIPQITDTDDQTVDTFDISSNVLRLSLQGDNQVYKGVSLSSYLDNTDSQTLSWVSGSGNLSISGGNTVNLDGRYLLTEVDGSTSNELQNLSYGTKSGIDIPLNISSGAGVNFSEGTNIFLDRLSSNYISIEGRTTIDTFSFASDTLKISLTNDKEAAKKVYLPPASITNNIVTNGNIITSTVSGVTDTTLAIRSVSNTSSTNNLSTTVNGVTGSNVNIINSNSNSLSGNVMTGSVNGISDTVLVIGNVTQTLASNNLSTTVNGVVSNTVSLSSYLDNTDNQALSIRAGKGTIDLTNSVSITLADSSATNEAWTIDGDDADTEVISNQTLKFEGAGIITTDYVPASDKLIITGTEVDGSTSNELQNLSYGAKSGSDVPVNISSGAGINLTQGANIYLDRIASNYLTIEGRTTIDTFSYSSDTLKISLTNDLEAAKKVYIPSGGATTNNIITNGNIITSTVNGVSDTTLAVRTVNGNLLGNTITINVNGVTDTVLVATHTLTSATNTLTSNVNGLAPTATIINSNALSSSTNTMTSTINGVANSGTGTIINSNVSNLAGNIITNTINGISDTVLVIGAATVNLAGNEITLNVNGKTDTVLVIGQHTLTSSANSMTNIENGLSASANIVNSISNTSSTNSLSTTVNGVTGSNVNIINSNILSFSGSTLTSNINGVSDTALINISGGSSKAFNGVRYSNDTIFRGSSSSSSDNGSKLTFNTYNYLDTYFDSYINATGGSSRPTLHLKANNDVWFGAQDTTTAGTAYASNNPVFYFRYANNGALNFGLNTTSNINRLGSGSINFGYTGSAKGDYAFNSGLSGIASSTYAINLGANGQAITGTAAFNSAAYGISSGFSSISMGYNSTVSNDYAFNSGRNSAASGYESVNMGAVGTASNTGSKNFGYNGQVSGYQSLGFQENNYTLGNYEMNGSYYTYSRAYGQSRFGYLGIDFTSQNASSWVSTDILFTIDNGKNDTTRSCALTMNARGWTQHRDIGTTQIKVLDSLAKPKAVLEIVSTTSGIIGAGGTKSQRDAIWNEGTQTGNFTPTYTKGWVNSAGNSVMDQCGLQFMTTNETLGSSLYVIRWNGSSYVWHQIY